MPEKSAVEATKTLIAKILFVMGGLLLINSVFLAVTTNMHHGHIFQCIVAAGLIVYGIFFIRIPRKVHFMVGGLALFPIAFVVFLAIYGNSGRVSFDKDVVIVLGAGLNGEQVGTHLARRLDTAIDYLNQNQGAVVVVTGGLGATQTITEALAMEHYLIARGIHPDRIIQEDQSTTTYENLVFAKQILTDHFDGDFRIVLVSNDFHMFRSVTMARQIGLDVTPLGASTPPLTLGVNYLREIVAIVHFWIFGA